MASEGKEVSPPGRRTAAGRPAGGPRDLPPPPAIILVEPQLPENIGAAARAMANFGVTELRLVSPREGWPNDRARPMASGADHVLDAATVFETVDEAVADLSYVAATTRRSRDMIKTVLPPAPAAAEIVAAARRGGRTGILFGRERTGLENDEVARANVIVTFPVDVNFASMNIAQSVLLMAYEWRKAGRQSPEPEPQNPRATREEVRQLWQHLLSVLRPSGYFRPPHMTERMETNLLLMLSDAGWDKQQVRTWRGVLNHLRPNEPRDAVPDGRDADEEEG